MSTATPEPLETPSELDEILKRVAEMGAEYAYFGSPFNTEEDNLAGAEALYQTTIEEAKAAIERLIADTANEVRHDTLLFVRSNACLEDIEWIDKQLSNKAQLKEKK